jgi:hypothetical protein
LFFFGFKSRIPGFGCRVHRVSHAKRSCSPGPAEREREGAVPCDVDCAVLRSVVEGGEVRVLWLEFRFRKRWAEKGDTV